MSAATVKNTDQKVVKENVRKWGQPLIDAGWSIIPGTIIVCQHELGLMPLDINIIMHLVNHWWFAERLPYPSKARLAAAMGVHKSTVQRRIRRMEKMGLIERITRKDREHGQMNNAYDLAGLVRAATPLAKEIIKQKEQEEVARANRRRPGKPPLKVVHGGTKAR